MAISADEAAEYALSEEGAPESPPAKRRADDPPTDLLSGREREVAAMVAGELSNRQIAQKPAAIDVDVSGVSRDEP
jgi:DNA-binding NarL/FixJ family response regulator